MQEETNSAKGSPERLTQKYFFVSRAGADHEAGKMIGGWLESAGYRVFIQDWDIEPGQNFLVRIHDALAEGAHVVALLSDAYFASPYCAQEWTAAVKVQQETGAARLTPFRITNCKPPGLLGPIVYIDLVGFDEESARQKVLTAADAVGGIARTGGSWVIPSPPDRPRFSNLEPFDDAAFAGRADELRQLHASLTQSDGKRVAVTALAGLGGVGKSALARAYCERHLAEYEVIWWVRAENEQDTETDLSRLAFAWEPANRRIESRREQALAAIRVASTWSGHRPFLLVFDNAASPSAVRPFRPSGTCRLLVTSRNVSWGREWRQMTVRKLDPHAAARLLLYATGRNDYDGARALANELDGLALPLTHAAAFLRENQATSFDDFIRRFDELMQWQTEDADIRTTYATYSIAIANVFEPHPIAETVMSVAAYCAPESIPLAIFDGAVRFAHETGVPSPAPKPVADRIKDAIGALGRYGLIDVESNPAANTSVSVHRVLQRVVRKQHLDRDEIERWGCAALRAIEQTAASLKEDATRHAQEALNLVPEDVCRGTRASLRSIVGVGRELGQGLPAPDGLIGRPHEIEQIDLLFAERGQRMVALVGPGGIGKTALARLYADSYRRAYEEIWWIDASSEQALVNGLIDAARRAGTATPSADTEATARMALEHAAKLSRSRPVLLIYDDVIDQMSIDRWRPQGNTRLLILSRHAGWSREVATLVLEPLSVDDAISLLQRSSGRIGIDQARQVAEALAGNPLALRLAGSLLERSPDLAVSDLIGQLGRMGEADQRTGPVLEASLKRLAAENPPADALLSLLAFCAADLVPLELIANAGKVAAVASRGLGNNAGIQSALAALTSAGLASVERDEVGTSVSGHALALEARRGMLSPEEQETWGTAALAAAVDAFPDLQNHATWVLAERVANQGLAIDEHVPARVRPWRARLLALIGTLRMHQGEYEAARLLFERAIEKGEADDDFQQDELASCLNSYSEVLEKMGRLDEAQVSARRALAISEKTGNRDEEAASLSSLALLFMQQNRLREAEPLLRRSLAVSEELGNTVGAARSLNTLAVLYRQQGKPAKGEPLVLHALANLQRVLGPEHPSVISTFNNLGALLQEAGRSADAEPVMLRALELATKVLGPDHPEVATGAANLAQLFIHTKRLDEAEGFARRALAIWETSLGPDHLQVGAQLSSLGQQLQRAGRYVEAEPLLQRALGILEPHYGPEHPRVVSVREALAWRQVSRRRRRRRRAAFASLVLTLALAIAAYVMASNSWPPQLWEHVRRALPR
jgi:tetratricopeptide (TPR) repeat protein/GTPase SAR1 family protein